MTKAQKRKIIYKAMEILATDLTRFSCVAIMAANDWSADSELAIQYGRFYRKNPGIAWFSDIEHYAEETRNQRLLMLALFAEAGL